MRSKSTGVERGAPGRRDPSAPAARLRQGRCSARSSDSAGRRHRSQQGQARGGKRFHRFVNRHRKVNDTCRRPPGRGPCCVSDLVAELTVALKLTLAIKLIGRGLIKKRRLRPFVFLDIGADLVAVPWRMAVGKRSGVQRTVMNAPAERDTGSNPRN